MTRRSLSALFQNVSVLLLVCVVLVVADCGGGGGGGGSPPVLIPLKTATIRTIVPGDTWHYSAAGQLTDDRGQHSITATVIVDILPTIIQSPVTSDNCLDQKTTITVGSISDDDHLYFNQDASGTIRSFGEIDDFGQDIWIVNPSTGFFIATTSPMAVGNSNSGSVTFTDGSSLSYSYSVTSIDNVATPVGYYESFKMTESSTYQYPSGYEEVVESAVWHVPGLGVIKVQSVDSLYSGGVLLWSLSYTATIDSTGIVY